MKKQVVLLILPLFLICACTKTETSEKTGYLTLNIGQATSLKADVEITDFILRITDGNTERINKRIGDLPEQIALPVGTYTVEAYSVEFSEPKFETPFYSGKTIVDIEADETKEASLICSQGNAGIKVVWSNDFTTLFQTFQAQITCDQGYLHYSSEETRNGYFLPGAVSISILADGKTIVGGTVQLATRDMVTASLKPYMDNSSGNLTISFSIDETVNERDIEIIVVSDNLDDVPNSQENPYNIAQAIARQGENGVWVEGYIVGSKPSSGYDFVNPSNWQATNIVLADEITETDDNKVIFVELAVGTYRTNLNLNDNDILHRKVLLKGNLLVYQSRSGLRNLTGGYTLQ